MWSSYINATNLDEVIEILTKEGEHARIIAGGTDLILEIERGVRKGINTLVDVSRIPDCDRIHLDEDEIIHLGPLVTHAHCATSKLISECALPLAQATYEVGAPQIRNRGTIAGNLITASPANDTITPLIALGARVRLQSKSGDRLIPLEDFYTGVRGTLMNPHEMMVDISFPAMVANQRGIFVKLALRRAQAISLVNVAIVLTFDEGGIEELENREVTKASITLGAVAPTIIHAGEAETFLVGRILNEGTIEEAAKLAQRDAKPIDDVRASADYRLEMVRVGILRGLRTILTNQEREEFPKYRVTLWGQDTPPKTSQLSNTAEHRLGSRIQTRINGQSYSFTSGYDKTLLRLLREEAGLTGTKEGCAEGECGACTVFLDGVAVMSCLVPAARAHGAEIVTVEGLSQNGNLHPIQKAFIESGAVQCGYCTPGFLMSGAKLLDERPHPTRNEIEQAITGNLCRCTGYYKIVQAIESASHMEVNHD